VPVARLLDLELYSFTALSTPYLVIAAVVFAIVLALLFSRGHPVIRPAALAMAVPGLHWAVFQVAALNCTDATAAGLLYRVGVAPTPLIAPSALTLVLAISDQLDRQRVLIAFALVSALAVSAAVVSTDLVFGPTWRTSWGIWYPRAGPLNLIVVAHFAVWGAVAASLGAREVGLEARPAQRHRYRRLVLVFAMMMMAGIDGLLAYGIGAFPMSWLPLLWGAAAFARSVFRGDLARRASRDWGPAWELAAVVLVGAAALAVFAAVPTPPGSSSLLLPALLTAVLTAGQAGITALERRSRRRGRVRGDARLEKGLEEFVDAVAFTRDQDELADLTAGFFRDLLGLERARVWIAKDQALVARQPVAAAVAVEPATRRWLAGRRAPLVKQRLIAERLRGHRQEVEQLMSQLDADVLLPMVDRQRLVGVLTADASARDGVLDEPDERVACDARDAVGRALTYLSLFEVAQAQAEIAREGEMAVATAQQQGRQAGLAERICGGWRVTTFYHAAGHYSGDWVSIGELADGRGLVAIGGATQQGVPAALLTASVDASCETGKRLLGARADLGSLVAFFDQSVRVVGRGQFAMTCFAILYDQHETTARFVNAGNVLAFLCRGGREGGVVVEVLATDAEPLGVGEAFSATVRELAVRSGDLIVMSAIDSDRSEPRTHGRSRELIERIVRSLHRADRDDLAEAIAHEMAAAGITNTSDFTVSCLYVAATGEPGGPES
jgi:serine phosphatase RsbU (regulator of sigma subunit)